MVVEVSGSFYYIDVQTLSVFAVAFLGGLVAAIPFAYEYFRRRQGR